MGQESKPLGARRGYVELDGLLLRTGCGNPRTGDRSIALGMAWNANQSRNFPIP